jgi:L-asparaginase
MTSPRPRITVFSTGGTIASVRGDGGAAQPSLTGEDLLRAVPELGAIGDIETVRFRQLASSELTLADMIALAAEIGRAIASGASAAIVTQGTDTLEETAFALDLLWDGEAPVVLTGAMRNATLPGADGPANLLASTLVAASPSARGLGALVVFNDEVHLPVFVRKTHTTNPATFRSTLAGPIGWIVENQVRIALRPAARHHIGIAARPGPIAPVALIKIVLGDDGRLLEAIPGLGCRGLVIEATGGGHVPSAVVEPLARLAHAMPVVLTSRTGVGELLRSTYGFPGSETDLLRRGLIHGGMLDGPKARILLSLLLTGGAGQGAIAEAFGAVGSPGSRPAFVWRATADDVQSSRNHRNG